MTQSLRFILFALFWLILAATILQVCRPLHAAPPLETWYPKGVELCEILEINDLTVFYRFCGWEPYQIVYVRLRTRDPQGGWTGPWGAWTPTSADAQGEILSWQPPETFHQFGR